VVGKKYKTRSYLYFLHWLAGSTKKFSGNFMGDQESRYKSFASIKIQSNRNQESRYKSFASIKIQNASIKIQSNRNQESGIKIQKLREYQDSEREYQDSETGFASIRNKVSIFASIKRLRVG
jgi:hypothetical protein